MDGEQPTLDGIAPLPAARPVGRPTKQAAVQHQVTEREAFAAGLPSSEETVALAMEHPEQFTNEFMAWLPDNHHVWCAFVYEAFRVIRRGFKHYSARTIIHVLRHHSAVTEVGSQWKINNNHSPYLARLFDPEARRAVRLS